VFEERWGEEQRVGKLLGLLDSDVSDLKANLRGVKKEQEGWGDCRANVRNLGDRVSGLEECSLERKSARKSTVSNIEFKGVISQVTDSLNGLKLLFNSLKTNSDKLKEEFSEQICQNLDKLESKFVKTKNFNKETMRIESQ
jgi:hypothetical protein